MKKLLLILFLPLLFVGVCAMVAPADQGEEANAKIKAIYIYNFTKYIEWPDDYKQGNFVVGVIGNSAALLGELNKMASTKTVGAQKFEIKSISSIGDVAQCHIVYILNESSAQLPDVIGKTKGKSALIVTDKDGLATKGSAINFVIVENKQKIELNKSNIEKYKLKVAAQLVEMAVAVK
ncbi:MAG: YfiR family protein [Bacteroidia bacterium]|nr:YfiR family protein [Bacteroidia bacterium]